MLKQLITRRLTVVRQRIRLDAANTHKTKDDGWPGCNSCVISDSLQDDALALSAKSTNGAAPMLAAQAREPDDDPCLRWRVAVAAFPEGVHAADR